MVKAIFFDIDGTLASFDTHVIPESTKRCIELLKQKGVKVFISTGRGRHELHILEDLVFDGYITLNGQYCFDGNENIIFENQIDNDSLSKLLDYVNVHQIACSLTDGIEAYYNLINDYVVNLHKMINTKIGEIKDKSYALNNKVYQGSVFMNEVQEKEMMKDIPNCIASRWHPDFFDISPKGGTKQNGVFKLCEYYNIDIQDTMSFGDGGNDIPMLECTGISVAMGNASVHVKSKAKHVTDTVDNDGIEKALKHFNII